MPNINNIVHVAEALEKSPVVAVPDRCVAVRNRNASCRRCVQVCPVRAIEVSANEISLDAGICVACGACAVVCPTEALVPVDPPDDTLSQAAANAMSENDGDAVFACARISSKRKADPARYAEVPCLARLDESLVLGLVADGARTVLFVDGTCSTCKYGACSTAIEATMLYANELIAAQGSDVRVARASSFPDNLLIDNPEGLFGSTRRGFFSDAANMAKETAMAAAKTTIEQEFGSAGPGPTIGERLRVSEQGTLPILSVARHDALINSMDRIGACVAESIESRRFASVAIDTAACNACGMCAVFCPTGALRREDADGPSSVLRQLEFWACDCIQCGLCADVCWKSALKLSAKVAADELFEFEPRIFDLRSNSPKKRLF